MLLGVHISGQARLYENLDSARGLGCNTMQIFSRSPQRWREHYIDPGDIVEFSRRKKEYKISPVFIHVPYLINLASPQEGLYQASIEAYIEDILEAHLLEADYIVTHMGSHKETSEESGLKRLTEALDIIIDRTRDTKVGILLENTSGSGSWLGYKFVHQKAILGALKKKDRVGLCFDTAHAYAAGYDIATAEGLKKTLQEIDTLVGLESIKLVHLNDSQAGLNSRHDRHQDIGKGEIGIEGMRRIINHPALRSLPFILETPKKTEGQDKMNLDTVRKLRR